MEFLKQLTLWQKRGIASVIGGIAGYVYYYYFGCVNGACAITGNPYISIGYGMLSAGLFIDSPRQGKKEQINGYDNPTTG